MDLKANMVQLPHIDWDPMAFNIPAGRTLVFAENTAPTLTGGSLPQSAIFSQVNGNPNLMFGFYTNDGGATTIAGLFKINDTGTGFESIVTLYDGQSWLNSGEYTLRYGIQGDFQMNIANPTLENFSLDWDITVKDETPIDLDQVYNEQQLKQYKLTAGDGISISDDRHNPVISATGFEGAITSPDQSLKHMQKISIEDYEALGENRDPNTFYVIIGDAENRAYMPVLDEANKEFVNRLPTSASTWTADRSGFVELYAGVNNGKAINVGFNIDGESVFQVFSGANTQGMGVRAIRPIGKGQTISIVKVVPGSGIEPDTLTCYFIPPKWEGFILPNIVDEPDYSLLEIDTGVKWIDGKTIHQKVVPFSETIAVGVVSNHELIEAGVVDTLVSGTGLFTSQSGNQFVIPFRYGSTQTSANIIKQHSTGAIIVALEWNSVVVITGHAILKYTKL
jgi:hypothetical protein